MVSHWCVFSRMERDDRARTTPDQIRALVCVSGLPWRIGGSRGVAWRTVLRPPPAFVRREIGLYAARLFSHRRCTTTRCTGRIRITSAARRDATRCVVPRGVAPPWFRAIGRVRYLCYILAGLTDRFEFPTIYITDRLHFVIDNTSFVNIKTYKHVNLLTQI